MTDTTRSTCLGCGQPLTPMTYRGNPKRYCTPACRQRHLRATGRATSTYARRSAVYFRTCTECCELRVFRSLRGTACARCQPAKKARLAREAYAANPEPERARIAQTRVTQTEEQRQREAERLRRLRAARPRATCCICGDLTDKPQRTDWRFTCGDLCAYYKRTGEWPTCDVPQPKTPKPPQSYEHLWSPFRKAVETGDGEGTIAAIRAASTVTSDGCWLWRKRHKDGYAYVMLGNKYYPVHRLALEARLGKTLGPQAAHHVCANSKCVNPDHLQPVTARENIAEMLARTYMVQRIAALEAALRDVAPGHELLDEISLAEAPEIVGLAA